MLSNLMIVVKLVDETTIYSKDFEYYEDYIVLNKLRYSTGKNSHTYIDDQIRIHRDAVDVFFVAHKGGLVKEDDGDFGESA